MMSTSKLMRIILMIGSVMIIVGVSLMTWMLKTVDERNVISVSLNEGDSMTVNFEALGLVPGDECEYGVKLVKGGANKFELKLDFIETGYGTLKDYARVKIMIQGNVIYEDLLTNALNNENILLLVDFDEDKNTELQIIYYLPIDVGNEAKNAEVNFGLTLTASNE